VVITWYHYNIQTVLFLSISSGHFDDIVITVLFKYYLFMPLELCLQVCIEHHVQLGLLYTLSVWFYIPLYDTLPINLLSANLDNLFWSNCQHAQN
jgi:hypothetical protein